MTEDACHPLWPGALRASVGSTDASNCWWTEPRLHSEVKDLKPRRIENHDKCRSSYGAPSSAILLHILPVSAQCGYNANDSEGHRKPLKNP